MKRHNISMASRLIPLFPLHSWFSRERRCLCTFSRSGTKKWWADAIRDNTEFGIVLAKDKGIVNMGCTVVVEKVVQEFPDGRMDVLTRGQQRFEILYLNEEKDYLQGEVNFFDDDDLAAVPAELREQAIGQYES